MDFIARRKVKKAFASLNEITNKMASFSLYTAAGKNLFDKDSVTIGQYIDGSGVLKTGTSGGGLDTLTNFSLVAPSTNYYTSHQCVTTFYDINMVRISTTNTTLSVRTFTTPINCYFVRLSIKSVDIGAFQLEEGNYATEYEPYIGVVKRAVGTMQKQVQRMIRDNLYYPDYIRPVMDVVASTELGYHTFDTFSFIFYTDPHTRDINMRFNAFPVLMSKKLPIDIIVTGGDLIDGLTVKTNELRLLTKVSSILNESSVPWLYVKGNHEDNDWYARTVKGTNLLADYINNLEIYNRTMQNSEPYITIGSKENFYYYYDNERTKIRCIILNMADYPFEANVDGTAKYNAYDNNGFSGTQLSWLANTALNLSTKSTPTDWGVIVFAHGYGDSLVRNSNIVTAILAAYKAGTSYTASGSGPWSYLDYNINVNYTNQGHGEVICIMAGDAHQDGITTVGGITLVRTLNAKCYKEHTICPERTYDTITENAFDIVTVNRSIKTVNLTRFGAGNDRSFIYS